MKHRSKKSITVNNMMFNCINICLGYTVLYYLMYDYAFGPSFSTFKYLIPKFVETATSNNPHKTVGPIRSSYLTARRFLIIAALHRNINMP
jgi:hypothetical protein